MGAGIKVLGGIILILIGLFLFSIETPVPWLTNFLVVLTGAIPILLILVGLFVVWLEIDEMKTQKELKKETKKPKKKKKK
jgi:cadmium resistance protein CadD (predicted permease)